jgi:hypothetical protein
MTIRRFSQVQRRCKVVQGEVLLLFPNLVLHPVSFHITVLVFSMSEMAITLCFAEMTFWSVILQAFIT